METNMYQYIRSVRLDAGKKTSAYPYSIDCIAGLQELHFHPKVTFLVGENGSGKSTLLEAIAIAYGFNAEGGSKNTRFSTEDSHSSLADSLQVVRGIRLAEDGYFLRAESFYNVASNIDQLDREEGFGPPIIESYGGISLHKQSHGEAFMALLSNRFSGKGLYILDEPEAALSPDRQLALLMRMHQLIEAGGQFIIATHSPIILGYPHAVIYSTDKGLAEMAYKETDHYKTTKAFLNNPEAFIDHLTKEL